MPAWTCSIVALARWSAELTLAGLSWRASAVSAAEKRRTSRMSITARCFAGRCCTAATNASRSVSLASAAAAGSAPNAIESGIGSTHM